MPPIPKFAKVLAQHAKDNPKVILGNTATKKFSKNDMELIKTRKQEIRKSLEKDLHKNPKDDLNLLKDLQNFKAKDKLQGHQAGDRVKIFNKDNLNQFVEILWPKEATVYNVVESVVRVMVEKYMKDKE